MDVRNAEDTEIDQIARVWFDAWRDAHLALAPPDLTTARTLASFRQRIADAIAEVRVVGPVGAPVGLCMIKQDELYQLFVASAARGSGAAAALLADGEARLAESGVQTAFLACAIGNDRAARFYEKHGWSRVGSMMSRLETPEGELVLEVWRYEKTLMASS
jgi:ribosomal protein S18 acetylase RimI-like enzyme